MPDRATLQQAFLTAAGWGDAQRTLIAGDASNRRYERLIRGSETSVLMDAPPEKGENVAPFVSVTRSLRDAGLSAPAIFAQDSSNGFLLLEDLGDDLFARVIHCDPTLEAPLYEAAVDVLVHLHTAVTPNLPRFDAATMASAACLGFDWYQRGAKGTVDTDARTAFEGDLREALTPLDDAEPVLVQRDYHAENLIWLPNREGVKRVGLLDYQDAVLGHPAYDLVSVLQDARRDVPPALQRDMIDRYLAATDHDADAFESAFALLGVQRNLRILGIFARLSLAYGKPAYVDLIPRVWQHLETGLEHPAAAKLAPLIFNQFPAPTDDLLTKLRNQCDTISRPS